MVPLQENKNILELMDENKDIVILDINNATYEYIISETR